MRVIAGQWRGRTIVAPKGEATRPTADRTRETLFNMLASRFGAFNDLKVADLFAGSGALGIEALSRGAGHCLFVEQDKAALDAIRANIRTFEARGNSDVRAASVMALPAVTEPYDLILLDPPYDTGAGAVALDRLLRLGWIGENTVMAVETGAKEPVEVKGLTLEKERRVGKAKLHILKRAD